MLALTLHLSIDFSRHWLVARVGVSARAITFGRGRRKRDVIVGLADHAVHCYNVGRHASCASLLLLCHRSLTHYSLIPLLPFPPMR